jgi:VWFA-related protein
VPLLILAALLAFAPVAGSQESTVFRANTQLVQINVIVRDKDGPVANLDKSDFTVTDRGKPRPIAVFSVHNLAALRTIAAALPPPLPVGTFSNRPLGGAEAPPGVTMILLDRLNTLIGSSQPGEKTPLFNGDLALANAKQHLLKFIDELGPRDRVAIYVLGTSLGVLSDFTSDRARLKRILENWNATSITSREVAEPQASDVCPTHSEECLMNRGVNSDRAILAGLSNGVRADNTMQALAALTAHVSGIPGRKNLVWLTSNLAISADAVARAVSGSDIAIYPVDARGLLPISISNSDTDIGTGGLMGMSPPRGTPPSRPGSLSSGASSDPTALSTLQVMAEETGGRAFMNNNDLKGALREAIEDGAVTYTLGFYVDTNSLDGKFHELKVHVKRSGLQVRTQRGYFALKDSAGRGPASLLALPVASPLESSALHVLARVERKGSALNISGSVDLRDLQLERNGDSSQGVVEIHLVQQDAAGKVLEGKHETLHLQLSPSEYDAYLKSGVFFRGTVEPKEGLATLRILVVDVSHSTVGSLIVPVSEIK